MFSDQFSSCLIAHSLQLQSPSLDEEIRNVITFQNKDQNKQGSSSRGQNNGPTEALLDQTEFFESKKHSKKEKSPFHNFQKHLITTLRSSIKMNHFQRNKEFEAENELWKLFLTHKRPNRSFLYFILEMRQERKEQDLRLRMISEEEDYQKLKQNYSENRMEAAHQRIKEQILSQCKEIDWKFELRNRRMQNQRNFETYLKTFLEELEHGRFKKRIPVRKSQKFYSLEEAKKDFDEVPSEQM